MLAAGKVPDGSVGCTPRSVATLRLPAFVDPALVFVDYDQVIVSRDGAVGRKPFDGGRDGNGVPGDVTLALVSGHGDGHSWSGARVHDNVGNTVVSVGDVGKIRMQMTPRKRADNGGRVGIDRAVSDILVP